MSESHVSDIVLGDALGWDERTQDRLLTFAYRYLAEHPDDHDNMPRWLSLSAPTKRRMVTAFRGTIMPPPEIAYPVIRGMVLGILAERRYMRGDQGGDR